VREYQRTNPISPATIQVYTIHLERHDPVAEGGGVDVAARYPPRDPAAPQAALTYTATVTSAGTQTATGVD